MIGYFDFLSTGKAAAGMNLARGGNIVYEDTTKQRRVAEREARRYALTLPPISNSYVLTRHVL